MTGRRLIPNARGVRRGKLFVGRHKVGTSCQLFLSSLLYLLRNLDGIEQPYNTDGLKCVVVEHPTRIHDYMTPLIDIYCAKIRVELQRGNRRDYINKMVCKDGSNTLVVRHEGRP